MSRGYTAKGEPEAWTVLDGKLYLNYSLDVRKTRAEDIPGNIANGNWPGVLNEQVSAAMAKPVIECRPDGPYVVKGLERLSNSKGEALPVRPVMALCRCGGSANKPFCDGTHARNGFSGARLGGGPIDRRRDHVGKGITIHDNRALCAHAGHCTEGLAAVFNSERRPWIDADGAAVEEIIEVVRRCPSGALSYSIGGVEHRDGIGEAAIAATKDGPYAVTGGAELAGVATGEGASTEHFTLCRCGASKNKPFCDGSHWDAGFRDG